MYIINKGLIFINYKLIDKPRMLTRYENLNSTNSTDLGASFLNFILTLNVRIKNN